jgi:peptidoglycan/xylan/chitin deacetylase (PgdA/CDA1 family)
VLAAALLATATAQAPSPVPLRPPAATVPFVPATFVLDGFDTGTRFAAQSASGNVALDPDERVRGDAALRLTTDGAAGQTNARAIGVGPFDLRDAHLRLHVRVDDPAQLEHVQVYLSSDGFAGHVAYRVLRGLDDGRSVAGPGEWVAVGVVLGTPLASAGAGVDLGAVTDLQVSVSDVGAGPVQVWVDALEAIPRPPRGVVSLVFDDARDGVARLAAPLLERAGLRASVAVVADLIDQPGFMTFEALQRLERFAGWDVLAHHARSLDDAYGFEQLTDEAIVAELVGIQTWLQRHGFHRGADHLAYPSGGFDARVVAHVRAGFASGRTIVRGLGHDTWPPVDPYRIRALSVRADDAPEALAAEVARAARERSWLVLVFHQVTDGPAVGPTDYAAADLARVLEAVAAADVDVRTPSELTRTGPR